MVTHVIDEFFVYTDVELLQKIRDVDEALSSPQQSASSKDVGSFTMKSAADLERLKTRMTRCYALRTGQVPLARPGGGVRWHKVFVTKDY